MKLFILCLLMVLPLVGIYSGPTNGSKQAKASQKKTEPAAKKEPMVDDSPLHKFYQRFGVQLLQIKIADEKTELRLRDEKNRVIYFSYGRMAPDEDTIKLALAQKNRFFLWRSLRIKKLRFYFQGKGFEAHVLPQSVTCSGKDYAPLIPAGIFLVFTDALEYHFRLNAKNIFIKIRGLYQTEKEICDKTVAAAKNPRAYMRNRDPEYVLEKLEELQKQIDRIKNRNIHLLNAYIALATKGVFSSMKPMSKKILARAIEMKRSRPTLRAEQLQSALRAEGMEIGRKEVELIFSAYFGEYP